uniref:Uncharacterized protein n=1 Tax=Tetranychus urticae TaxID=32264 RepID=T1JXD9_TETUR
MSRVDGYLRPFEPACFSKIISGVALGLVLGAAGGVFTGTAMSLRMGFRGRVFSMRVLKHMSVGGAHGGVIFGVAQSLRY